MEFISDRVSKIFLDNKVYFIDFLGIGKIVHNCIFREKFSKNIIPLPSEIEEGRGRLQNEQTKNQSYN